MLPSFTYHLPICKTLAGWYEQCTVGDLIKINVWNISFTCSVYFFECSLQLCTWKHCFKLPLYNHGNLKLFLYISVCKLVRKLYVHVWLSASHHSNQLDFDNSKFQNQFVPQRTKAALCRRSVVTDYNIGNIYVTAAARVFEKEWQRHHYC